MRSIFGWLGDPSLHLLLLGLLVFQVAKIATREFEVDSTYCKRCDKIHDYYACAEVILPEQLARAEAR